MYVGGQEWAVPLSPLRLSLSSLPHVFSCSSCRTPHLLSQGHAGGSLRDHCCTTGQPGRPQPARQHPRAVTGDPSEKKQKPSVSIAPLPSMSTYVSVKQQHLPPPHIYRTFKKAAFEGRRDSWPRLHVSRTILSQLSSAPYKSRDNVAQSLRSFHFGSVCQIIGG